MTDQKTGHDLKLLISSDSIQSKVEEIGKRISADYRGKIPILICTLKGAFVFLSDLIRSIDIQTEIDFIWVSSYKSLTEPESTELISKNRTDLKDRHVILIEDIIDTGITAKFIQSIILSENPKSLKVCSLLDKRERRKMHIKIDYTGFVIEKGFVVGYGMDYGERGRELRHIYILNQ